LPSDYNPDELVERLAQDKVHGANWLSDEALRAMKQIVKDTPAEDTIELIEALTNYAVKIARSRPSMAPITNKLGAFLNRLDNSMPLKALRDSVADYTEDIVAKSSKDEDKLVENCKNLLPSFKAVMTFSYSSTVQNVLKGTGVEKILLTESRPKYEGSDLAKLLASRGFKVTLAIDSAMATLVEEADAVIVGADSVLRDGSIINKVGSYPLALTAKRRGIPFYAVCETWKFNVLNYLGERVVLEEKDPMEVADIEGVTVRNPYFEVVPSDLIDSIVTESGLMSHSDIVNKMESMKPYVSFLLNDRNRNTTLLF
jgi:ribose 1,5-bisphosphate isomerase